LSRSKAEIAEFASEISICEWEKEISVEKKGDSLKIE
jgi:hypothetical protein